MHHLKGNSLGKIDKMMKNNLWTKRLYEFSDKRRMQVTKIERKGKCMKKKVLAMLLSAAMIASMLVGCGGSGATQSDSSSSDAAASEDASGETADGASDDAAASDSQAANNGETVKLTGLAILHPLTQDISEMEYVKEIEAEAGVEIEWEIIRADWDQVKSTRFASGDIPDLLFNATTNADYQTYKGLFLELTPYITEELTPNIVTMFEEEPDTKALATTLEGEIYAAPKFQGKWPDTNTVMFINQQWLDNLGLEMPTTFSELKDVLIAFKEQDANGNGDASDEVPLDFNGWFGSAYSLPGAWMGGMGIQLTNQARNGYFAEGGEVKNYAVDERYKLFMKYVADLYANGVINTNAVTNDYSMFQSLSRGNEAGDAMVGVVPGWEETDKFGPELYSQYVALPPLDYDIDCEAGTYDTRWKHDFSDLNMSANRVAVKADCANPEAAMRFIDRFYDQTHSVEVLFGGIADGNLEKTGDNSYQVLDPPAEANTDPGTWKWTSTFADNGPMYIRRASEVNMPQDMTNATNERKAYADALAKATTEDMYPDMFMKYSSEDENNMALLQANIDNVINNQWAVWMVGEQDIDSTWDAYVQSVYDAGLQEVLDIRQAAFDTYLGK